MFACLNVEGVKRGAGKGKAKGKAAPASKARGNASAVPFFPVHVQLVDAADSMLMAHGSPHQGNYSAWQDSVRAQALVLSTKQQCGQQQAAAGSAIACVYMWPDCKGHKQLSKGRDRVACLWLQGLPPNAKLMAMLSPSPRAGARRSELIDTSWTWSEWWRWIAGAVIYVGLRGATCGGCVWLHVVCCYMGFLEVLEV